MFVIQNFLNFYVKLRSAAENRGFGSPRSKFKPLCLVKLTIFTKKANFAKLWQASLSLFYAIFQLKWQFWGPESIKLMRKLIFPEISNFHKSLNSGLFYLVARTVWDSPSPQHHSFPQYQQSVLLHMNSKSFGRSPYINGKSFPTSSVGPSTSCNLGFQNWKFL